MRSRARWLIIFSLRGLAPLQTERRVIGRTGGDRVCQFAPFSASASFAGFSRREGAAPARTLRFPFSLRQALSPTWFVCADAAFYSHAPSFVLLPPRRLFFARLFPEFCSRSLICFPVLKPEARRATMQNTIRIDWLLRNRGSASETDERKYPRLNPLRRRGAKPCRSVEKIR